MCLFLDMLIRWVDETAGPQNEDDSEPQAEEDLESQDEEGSRLQDEEDSKPRVDRVLWMDPSGTNAVTIDIFDKRAKPKVQECQVILDAIRDGDAQVLKDDPYEYLLRPEKDISPKYREYRDRAWDTIVPLVKTPEIFVPSKRGLLVREASERTGHTKATIYRWLKKFWQRGPYKNSLLPDFECCGAPGVDRPVEDALASEKRGRRSDLALETGDPKGINITEVYRQRILRGIKEFYRPRKVSMKEARQKTLEKYFKIGYRYEDSVKIAILPPDDELPSIHQFRYYYNKYRDPVRALKLQYGESRYASDFRPVLSHSRDMSFGPGSEVQLDFAIAKIELVSFVDRSKRIGMPLMGIGIDVFSGMIAGLSITPEHESGLALVLLLENTFSDKVPLSQVYGIPFTEFEWPYKGVAEKALLDRGPGEGPIATNWADTLNMEVQNTQARRPDLKGLVERHCRAFREEAYIDLPGAYPRDKRRDGPDPREEACLTIYEFTQIMIWRVLEYNSLTLMQNYPMDPDMIADGILPRPLELWHWGIQHRSGHLRVMSPDTLRVNLLPKKMASLDRTGLHFRNLDYVWPFEEKDIVDAGVRGTKKFPVAYDPRLVNAIYLRLNDRQPLACCELRPKHHAFLGWTWDEVEEYQRFLKVAEQADGTRKNEVRARRNAYKERIVKDAGKKAERAKKGKSKAALLRGVKENRAKERTLERKRSVGTLDGDVESSGIQGLVTEPEYAGDESTDERVPWPQDVSALRKLRERGPEND